MLIHAIALASISCAGQNPTALKPLDPALQELSKFVGGTWMGEGKMPIQQEWTWNRDKRGLTINTTIGKGTPNERMARAFLGWDPVAKKPYYLDMHDSETTYHGHLYLTDGTVEFRFGQIGSGKIEWIERGKFVGQNEWRSTLLKVAEGKETVAHSFVLKRIAKS
jgi:hypothetical protein